MICFPQGDPGEDGKTVSVCVSAVYYGLYLLVLSILNLFFYSRALLDRQDFQELLVMLELKETRFDIATTALGLRTPFKYAYKQ